MTVRSLLFCGAMAAAVAHGGAARAAVLLNETWADGSRTETNLPNESAFFVGIPSSGGMVTVTPGQLSMTQGGSNQKLWTYFAPNGNPAQIPVGEKLIATIEFLPQGALYDVNSRNFRMGLFHDPTNNQIVTDVNSDGGGAGNPWADARGYALQMPLTSGPTTANAFQIGKRTVVDGSQTSLLGSNSAYTNSPSGGAQITHQLDTLYTLVLELNHLSASQLDITATISDPGGVLASHTVSDDGTTFGAAAPYTSFDHLFFRFSSASGTADELQFRSVRIEITPEPGSLVLTGLGSLALVAMRRRS